MKAKLLFYKLACVAGLLLLLPSVTKAQCNNFTSYFTLGYDSANCKKVIFSNKSTETDSNTTYKWVFGDGNQSTGKNADHTYAANDTFTVCLYITKVVGNTVCKDSICKDVIINCTQTSCKVEANFTFRSDSGNCKKIIYTNTSGQTNNNTTYSWKFGDNGTSQDKNTSHTYNDSTTYTVCLKVVKTDGNVMCADSICKQVSVCPKQNSCGVQAYFSYQSDSGNCKKIHFTNQSAQTNNNTTYSWKFGDNGTSQDKNTAHTYGDSTTYTVCLKVVKTDGNVMCADSFCKQVSVCPKQGGNCNVEANFTYRPDSANCKKIIFTNTSAPVNNSTTYQWAFGDNNTSGDKNTMHEFNRTGAFTVCMIVTKTDGNNTCKDTICKNINITCDTGCKLTAYFTYVRDSANCKKIHFANVTQFSNNTTAYYWTFGDNSGSADKSPTHTYNDTGYYRVCLRAVKTDGNKVCIDSICKIIHVECVSCHVNAEFSSRPDSGDCKRVFFKPNAPTGGTFKWNFGDGTTATNYDPGHTYGQSGTYTVCLWVTKVENNKVCKDSFCRTVYVCVANQVEEMGYKNTATVYPNPFTNQLTINFSSPIEMPVYLTISDVLGKIAATEIFEQGKNQFTINTSQLPKGIYFIELTDGTTVMHRMKVVK